jgi:hypothetical protein
MGVETILPHGAFKSGREVTLVPKLACTLVRNAVCL